jgi:hypothetical protein
MHLPDWLLPKIVVLNESAVQRSYEELKQMRDAYQTNGTGAPPLA